MSPRLFLYSEVARDQKPKKGERPSKGRNVEVEEIISVVGKKFPWDIQYKLLLVIILSWIIKKQSK